MAAYFLDSSALVKRFTRETGMSRVVSLFRGSNANSIYIARITPLETASGLAKQNRIGSLSSDRFDKAMARLVRGNESRYIFAEINDDLVKFAIPMVLRDGLRGFDAIQLAAAIGVAKLRRSVGASELVFVSADNHLNRAAIAEGLIVENPAEFL